MSEKLRDKVFAEAYELFKGGFIGSDEFFDMAWEAALSASSKPVDAVPVNAQTVTDEQICDALQAENVYPYPSIVKAIRALLSAQAQPERICTHPEGCTHCGWCGFNAQPVQELSEDILMKLASHAYNLGRDSKYFKDDEVREYVRSLLTGKPQ